LTFSDIGEAAVLFDGAKGEMDLDVQRQIWALSAIMEKAGGIIETVPGMNNLLVVFDPLVTDRQDVIEMAEINWPPPLSDLRPGRLIEIPVVYGGEYGTDLSWMAERAGMSREEFARLHASSNYTVFALGGQPGFAFLGGLDPRLATPRREVPRVQVAAGSVMIGGVQTGIYPTAAPSGWNLIGHTHAKLFDINVAPPALLAPGDIVRIVLEDILP